ncbi:MAG: helix-turn-helix transcriptional regulator [Agathobacter sp.]|nr:helix-turn-helix transcriptional regulator [Agathobacter sp.]
MQERKAGELLRWFRLDKNVTAKKLGGGICSETAISNYEKDSRALDTVLLEVFLERLGVSEENFAFLLSEEEYAYFTWKSEVYHLIETADWDILETVLLKPEAVAVVGNDKIQKQFYKYVSAILEAEKYAHYKIAADYLAVAIEQTMGDIHETLTNGIPLSVQELHIALLYLHYSLCAARMEKTMAERMFYELKTYILNSHLDIMEKCKIYPKLLCIWMNHQGESISKEEKRALCESGINLLKEGMQFNDVLELFHIYIPLLEKESVEYAFYQKQKESFEELFAFAEIEERFRPEYMIRKIPKIYLITEYLKNKRMEMNLTQNQISEGICEPETYSRIESGRRAPSKKNRRELLDRVNVRWHYFRWELESEKLELYQLERKYKIERIKDEWQEAYNVLQKMKLYLDMESSINRQFILNGEATVLYQMNRITMEECYSRLWEALRLTTNVNMENDNLVYYTQTELEIIGEIGKLLRKSGKLEEAECLLKQVLKQMSQSKVSLKFHWNGVGFVKRVLAGVYFSKKMYVEGYELRKEAYEIEIKERDGAVLANLLDGMADDLEHIGEQYKETYMLLYRLTYYVSDFYEINTICDFSKKYYEKLEPNYKWY